MIALPIPDPASTIRYRDVRWNGWSLGRIVSRLDGATPSADQGAHLDPDLRADALFRAPGWRPIFGQHGSAEGHLANQGIGPGDLFLFFGLFRQMTESGNIRPRSGSRHVVWGCMQVDARVPVDAGRGRLAWASSHPHLTRGPDPTNVVYLGGRRLRTRQRTSRDLAGTGVFPRFDPALQLTAEGAGGPSLWRLPGWFHPADRSSALSYHGEHARWTRDGSGVLLRAVGWGQEFVLDGRDHPEAEAWAVGLIASSAR